MAALMQVIISVGLIFGASFASTIPLENYNLSDIVNIVCSENSDLPLLPVLIQCYREHLIEGVQGLPLLAPLRLPEKERLKIDKKYLRTDLSLSHTEIEGLMSFQIDSARAKCTKVIGSDFPEIFYDVVSHYSLIHFSTIYAGQINVLNNTFGGQGTFNVALYGVRMKTSVGAFLMSYELDKLLLSINTVKITMTGLLPKPWDRIFNMAASYIATSLVHVFQVHISKVLTPPFREFIDYVRDKGSVQFYNCLYNNKLRP